MKHFRFRFLTSALLCGLIQTGQAECPLDGARPVNIGPHNPVTTFPLWVQDSEGLAVEICPGTDQVNCISVPPFTPANTPGLTQAQYDLSAQIGSGDEAFWASADAQIDIPASGALATGGRARLVAGVEAAFLPDFNNGNQTAFTRLRFVIDIPRTGTYTVTHPWGQISYVIDAVNNPPGKRAIFDSHDIAFVANEVGSQGRLGPILTWDTFPGDPLLDTDSNGSPDYIGTINFTNPDTGGPEHLVTGSPCGTNYFRIDGPDIGGPGVNSIETNLFTVTGKVFTGAALPTPLAIDQATYSRSTYGPVNIGHVNVFATAPTMATVHFTGGGNIPAGTHVMNSDGSNRHFGTVAFAPGNLALPPSIEVTADNNANPVNLPTTIVVPLIDLISISRADYDKTNGVLTVEASSSDQVNSPTLTTLGQTLTNGVVTINNLLSAPASVTVTSTAGGSATYPVTVINPVGSN
jgi:hypothetical protein